MKKKIFLTALLSILTLSLGSKGENVLAHAYERPKTPPYIEGKYYEVDKAYDGEPYFNYLGAHFLYPVSDNKIQLKHSLKLPYYFTDKDNFGEVGYHLNIYFLLEKPKKGYFEEYHEGAKINLFIRNEEGEYYLKLKDYVLETCQDIYYNELLKGSTVSFDKYHTYEGEYFKIDIHLTYTYYNSIILEGNEAYDRGEEFYVEFPKNPNKNYKPQMGAITFTPKQYAGDDFNTMPSYNYGEFTEARNIYYDGYIFKFDMDYDNRLLPNEIIKEIHAYDYTLEKEIGVSLISENLTEAIQQNSLGECEIKVSATDSLDNTSTMKMLVNIIDRTAPDINGNSVISISYTELNEDNSYDVIEMYTVDDNHDGKISLKNTSFILEKFKTNDIKLEAIDSSSNKAERIIHIDVKDDVPPTIKGPSTLEYFEYDFIDEKDILSQFTFDDDGDRGSQIVETYIKEDYDKFFTKAGDYSLTIGCKDKYGNEGTFNVDLKIKNGIGPVFFINDVNLSLDNSKPLTANELVSLAMSNSQLTKKEYHKVVFLDDNYSSNYSKEGTYSTKVVCIDEDGNKEYYRFNVKVNNSTSFFVSLFNSFTSFINNILNFFKYIWSMILNIFNHA